MPKRDRAAVNARMEVVGDVELERMLLRMSQAVASELLADALEAGAEPVVAKAKQLVPKRSGQLERSIRYELAERSDRLSQGDVGPASGPSEPDDGFYGFWVEFGNYGKPGTPFMSRAAEMSKDEAQKRMSDVIEKALSKAAR